MEKWQTNFITKNLNRLVSLTSCNRQLLNILISRQILTDSDAEIIEAIKRYDGTISQSSHLYKVLQRKKDAYEELAFALYQTKQTGAYELIKAGFPSEQRREIIKRIEDNRIHFILDIKSDTKWNEISKRKQDEFVEQTINFMGKKITIRELLSKLNLNCKNVGELIDSTLGGDSLRKIFKLEYDIEVINGLRPEPLSYYVGRKLISRNEVDPRIFDEVCEDVFVVKFIEMHTLSSLVKHSVVERSTTQLEELTGRYIAQEFDHDFATIVELGRAQGWPVHQLEYRQGKLYWLASHGNFSTIQQFLRDEVQETLTEKQAGDKFVCAPQPVIISDTAGMGKSELLDNLGRTIFSKHPERLVLFVTLRKFIDALPDNCVPHDLMNATHLCKILAANFSNCKFGQELLARYILEQVYQMELLLDGFDEILPRQKDMAMEAIGCLAKMGNVRVYITTRPHLQDDLEVLLNSVSYHISPFPKEDQFLCMVKYWRNEHKIPENEKLRTLAKECLKVLSANMIETDREIAGVPLQCRLLAEVYLHLAKCCSEERQSLKYFESLISVESIFQLYDNYSSIRLHEKLEKREMIIEEHVYLALELFFPDWLPKFAHLSHRQEVGPDQLLGVGLLEINRLDRSIKFIHQSVAEFLVAKYVVSIPDDEKIEHFSEFVLNEVMSTEQGRELPVHKHAFGEWTPITTFTFSHPVVGYFINGLVHNPAVANTSSIETSFVRGGNIEGNYFEGTLTAAVCHDYVHIARRLVDLHSKLEDNRPLPAYNNLLLLSAKHSSKGETLKILSRPKLEYKKLTFQNCQKYRFQLTPLHVAAHIGCFESVEVLLKYFHYENFIRKLQFLGHMCVRNSVQEKTRIGEKVNILRMLQQTCKSSANLIDEQLPDGTTPLLQKQVHFELLKCLMELECDINYLNEDDECVLHTIFKNSQHLHPEEYHELVQLLQGGAFLHYDLTSKRTSRTPLHLAMQYIEITSKTLDIFISKQVDINSKDSEGNSILFVAVAFNRKRNLLVELKRHGANSSHKNNVGENILHFASKHGNLKAVEEFFRDVVDINEVDHKGNVALHFAVISKETKYEEIQMTLIDEGANVNSINSMSLTPFLHGMKNGRGLSLKVVEAMEKKGLTIDPKMASIALKFMFTNMNTNGWNWDSELTKAAKYLIMKKGGVIKYQNLEVSSPWELEEVEEIMGDLEKEIKWKGTFDQHLRTFNLLIASSEMALRGPGRGRTFRDFLMNLRSVEGSYEKLMCCLIASNQKSPFVLLRQCLQADVHESVIFVKPPQNFDLLQDTKGKRELIILSHDIQTTKARILSTVDVSIPVIEDINNLPFGKDEEMVMVICKDGDIIEEYFQREQTHKKLRIAFILYHLHWNESLSQMTTDMNMTTDDISWKDLTFQLRKKISNMILGKVVLDRDIFQELTATSLLPILKLTKNMTPFLCPSKDMAVFPLKFSRRNVLSSRMFEHHSSDLIVVNDMDEEVLKNYTCWGQKMGVSYDQIKKLDADYIILKDNRHFEEICQINRTGQAVHWLVFNNENSSFELKDSHGSISGICQFLESNPKNRVASEFFFENGGHLFPSIILIKAEVTSYHKIFDMIKHLPKRGGHGQSHHAHFIELSLALKRASAISSTNSSLKSVLAALLEINDLNFSEEETSTWNIVFGTVGDESEESITKLRILIEKACKEVADSTITVRFWLLAVHSIWKFEQAFNMIGYELVETKPDEIMAFITNKHKGNSKKEIQTKFSSSFVKNYKQKHIGASPIISESFLNRTKLTFPIPAAVGNFEFYAYLFDSILLFEDTQLENHDYDIPPPEELFKKLFTHYFESVFRSVNKEDRHDFETKLNTWLIFIAIRSRFPQWLSVFKQMKNCLRELEQNDTCHHPKNNDITFARKEMSDYVIAHIFIFPKFSEDLVRDELVKCLRTLLTTFEQFHTNFPLRVFSHSGLLYFIDKLVREETHTKYITKLVEDALENDSNLAKDCIRACVLGSFVNILKVILEKRFEPSLDILSQDLLDLAVMFANEKMMKFMLEINKHQMGIFSVSINGEKWTLPHLAARRGDYAVMKFLLGDGYFGEDTKNNFFLHNCLIDSNLDRDEVVLNKIKIIELVAPIPGGKCFLERYSNGCTPLHTQNPHIELLRHLIKSGVDPSVQDNQGCTMLHYLPKYLDPAQYTELIAYLISEKKTKCFKIVDKEDCTFLHRAVLTPNISPETLHLLHDKRVSNFKAVTEKGNPLLHCAIQGRANNAAVIRTLLVLTGFKTMDSKGNNVLHLAAQLGNLSLLNFSLAGSQDLNNINSQNTDGMTPLHLAFYGECQGNLVKMLKFLQENHADVNAEDKQGRTPVHWAATVCNSTEWLAGIRFLLEHGADLLKGDATGCTILHTAPYYRTAEEFHQLVGFIVECSLTELFTARCQYQCNAVHIAVRQLELKRRTLERLSEYADINAQDHSGNPPLFYAIEGKRSELFLEWMVELGADWRIANNKGHTVVHASVGTGNLTALGYLISKGIDMNTKDTEGNTPLHVAFSENIENVHDVVEILVHNGADVTLENCQGRSPLTFATEMVENGTLDPRMLKLLSPTEQDANHDIIDIDRSNSTLSLNLEATKEIHDFDYAAGPKEMETIEEQELYELGLAMGSTLPSIQTKQTSLYMASEEEDLMTYFV